MSKRSAFGPGALITAAFIGPGTVTVCTLAGISDGFSLLWAILLAILICYLMQEMAARLGLVSRQGLGEVLRGQIESRPLRIVMLAIVFGAIVIGNAAYEAGNISGGALGLEAMSGVSGGTINLLIAMLAAVLLYTGSYRILERALIAMVLLMSVAFVLVAVATRPDIGRILAGLLPTMSAGQTLTVIGLIGTTVVPYNLFLHASIVQEKWPNAAALPAMRRDTAVTILVGGIISMAIIVSAAAIQGAEVTNAAQLARSLEPIFGAYSRYILAIGLFAAGVTSAITAPLAAAYAASGCFGWTRDLRSARMRMTWLAVLLAGLIFSVVGGSPIEIIRFAQVTNGILLPLIVGFVLWAVNREQLVGAFANSRLQNLLGMAVLIVVSVLSLRSLWLVLQSLL
jgi:NRAMP (natural resistance-associated macrophage protein)-like metal ion transporter